MAVEGAAVPECVVRVYGPSDDVPDDVVTVNVTSRSKTPWSRGLSPFFLRTAAGSVFENVWQGLKVYDHHVDGDKEPTAEWRRWSDSVLADPKPQRRPMGFSAKPLFAMDVTYTRKMTYVESRVVTYAPLYTALVRETSAWAGLQAAARKAGAAGQELWLFDFDGYVGDAGVPLDLTSVLYNAGLPMGHGFVLAGMLTGDRPWERAFDAAAVQETYPAPFKL